MRLRLTPRGLGSAVDGAGIAETRRGISVQEGDWESDREGEERDEKNRAPLMNGDEDPHRGEVRKETTGAIRAGSKHTQRKRKEYQKSDKTTTMRPIKS